MPREVRVQHWLATLPKDSSFRASLQRPLLVTPFRVPLKGDSFPSVGVSPEQRPGSFLRGIAGVLHLSREEKQTESTSLFGEGRSQGLAGSGASSGAGLSSLGGQFGTGPGSRGGVSGGLT